MQTSFVNNMTIGSPKQANALRAVGISRRHVSVVMAAVVAPPAGKSSLGPNCLIQFPRPTWGVSDVGSRIARRPQEALLRPSSG
jgi:hypothetical protein